MKELIYGLIILIIPLTIVFILLVKWRKDYRKTGKWLVLGYKKKKKEDLPENELFSPAVRESQGFFSWWFNPRNSCSIVKIPLGLFFSFLFIFNLIRGISVWISILRTYPLTIETVNFVIPVQFLLFPLFFATVIFLGGLLYLPYYVFEKKKGDWKTLLIYVGVLFVIIFILYSIGYFVFGFTYW